MCVCGGGGGGGGGGGTVLPQPTSAQLYFGTVFFKSLLNIDNLDL